jgi:hypothetical protein
MRMTGFGASCPLRRILTKVASPSDSGRSGSAAGTGLHAPFRPFDQLRQNCLEVSGRSYLYLPNGNPTPGPKLEYKLHWFERHRECQLDRLAPHRRDAQD